MNAFRIRQFVRARVLDVLGAFARPAAGVHILNGHKITENAGSGTEADAARFDALLSRLAHDCEFVNFEDAVRMIEAGERPSVPKVAFSFDDGFEDCYTCIAPVLEKHGVNAMFFINPNFATAADNGDEEYIRYFTDVTTDSPGKRPMSWAQIEDLRRRGFLFGAHTMDHTRIADCGEDGVRTQIVDCRKAIEERLGCDCDCFAWPYGKLTDADPAAVEAACSTYRHVFSQGDHRHYFSFGGRAVNRRHFEVWWPVGHVRYFLSCKKQ